MINKIKEKQMKFKSVIAALLLSIFLAGSAYALPWSWDLSKAKTATTSGVEASIVGGWSSVLDFGQFMGVVNGPNPFPSEPLSLIPFPGYSKINQSLGVNGELGENDTFTELGFLSHVNVDSLAVQFRDFTTHENLFGYFRFSGLSGHIYNYDANSGGATTLSNLGAIYDDEFRLAFDPGVGTIDFWIDDDFNPTNGSYDVKIADFTLVAGDGSSPQLEIGGVQEGKFGLIVGFTDVLDDVWSFSGGDFEAWLGTYGPSSIALTSFNLGATLKGIKALPIASTTGDGNGNDAILFDIFNHGDFELSATPEPATLMLFGIGLLGLAGVSRKKLS